MIPEKIKIISVPTEAGTHFPGQRLAPEAIIQQAYLPSKLSSLGYDVTVDNDLIHDAAFAQAAPWSSSPKINGVRNEANTVAVMKAIHRHMSRSNHDEEQQTFPIVLGGDCSITPAVFSALHTWHPVGTRLGLLRPGIQRDPRLHDYDTPDRPGGLESMRQFTNTSTPLIDPSNIVLFGLDPLQPSAEHWTYLTEQGYKVFTRSTISSPIDAITSMRSALAYLRAHVDVVYVHFDVDVIDSGMFPLANYPHYAGLEFEVAMGALREALEEAGLVRGLTVTEVNPNNDPDGRMVGRLVDGVVEGMARRRRQRGMERV